MIIILKNHNEEYSVREITTAYFQKEKIFFSISKPENEDYILSEYQFANGKHIYMTEVRLDNKIEKYELLTDVYSKNHIKKSISNCLEKATGIHLPWGILTGIRPSKIVREYITSTGNDICYDYLHNTFDADIEKSKLAWQIAKNEKNLINNINRKSYSLYIGIPFCPSRCLYCSFTSQSINYSNKLTIPYIEALKREITEISKIKKIQNSPVDTVYFGGGTPSALTANQIDDIITHLENCFDLEQTREITFEAGRPDTIDEEKLTILKKHGISRISINPQTTNDLTLKTIGRNHTTEQFIKSFNLARNLGFAHINCDIIAGLPDENIQDFRKTLTDMEKLSPESITVHTMCIKHGSYLDMKYDMYSLSTADNVNNMLLQASESMEKSGKIPYYMYRQKNMLGNLENVGYCVPGHECLYNIYIMEEVQSIISLGAGGSTKIVTGDNVERVFNVKEVSEYIKRINEMIARKETLIRDIDCFN